MSHGDGPVALSEWVELEGTDEGRLLVVRTPLEPLPSDAIEEIRGERLDPDFEAANVSVQLVLGLDGKDRLYVVLPTTVEWAVPFSVNAPFVQDPTRTGIKEPALSTLNRWLLRRAGRLAGETLVDWVSSGNVPVADRVGAYELLGPVNPSRDTVGGSAAADVAETMRETISEKPVLLAHGGVVVKANRALDMPPELDGVWTTEGACQVFADVETHVLDASVPARYRDKLGAWGLLDRLDRASLIEVLSRDGVSVPRPSQEGVLKLWAYLEGAARPSWHSPWLQTIHAVPVAEAASLMRPTEVVVPDASVADFDEEDWRFLSEFLPIIDWDWVNATGLLTGAATAAQSAADHVPEARSLWKRFGFESGVGRDGLVARVAAVLSERDMLPQHGVHLAHTAARIGATAPQDFPYLTEAGAWTSAAEGVISPGFGFSYLLPQDWLRQRLLNSLYEDGLEAEALREWRQWEMSPKSRLRAFASPERRASREYGRHNIEALYTARGGTGRITYPYQRPIFVVVDHDLPTVVWRHWEQVSATDTNIWARVIEAIGRSWTYCRAALELELQQEGSRYVQKLQTGRLPAAWLHCLRGISCLPDEFGRMTLPGTLLRHTADTAFLHDIEPFVHPDLDRTELHELLDSLGVRSDPSNATTLLGRLRALAQAPQPPEDALLRLYAALDRLVARLPGDRAAEVKEVFEQEPVIRTEDGAWSACDG